MLNKFFSFSFFFIFFFIFHFALIFSPFFVFIRSEPIMVPRFQVVAGNSSVTISPNYPVVKGSGYFETTTLKNMICSRAKIR